MLKNDLIIELDDEIPFKNKRMRRFQYTTLEKFIEAESTENL